MVTGAGLERRSQLRLVVVIIVRRHGLSIVEPMGLADPNGTRGKLPAGASATRREMPQAVPRTVWHPVRTAVSSAFTAGFPSGASTSIAEPGLEANT